jgi:hypothetical protein
LIKRAASDLLENVHFIKSQVVVEKQFFIGFDFSKRHDVIVFEVFHVGRFGVVHVERHVHGVQTDGWNEIFVFVVIAKHPNFFFDASG